MKKKRLNFSIMKKIIILFFVLHSCFSYSQCLKVLVEDLAKNSKEFKAIVNENSGFKAWQVLAEHASSLRTDINELNLVSKNLEAIEKAGGYTKWKAIVDVGKSGSVFKNTVKFVDNYKPTSTGKIAEIISENGEVLGTLYKQKQFQTSTLLEYSYKYKTPSGNVKTFNKLYSKIDENFIEFDLNIPNELKGQGLGTLVFEDAIKYYDIKNPNYNGIRGNWQGNNSNYIDGACDNFKAFKNAKLTKGTIEEAAFETWTGKQAQKQGFKKANIITDNDNQVLVEFIK